MNKGLPHTAVDIILSSIRSSSARVYEPHIQRYVTFCSKHGLAVNEPNVFNLIKFLTEEFQAGKSYSFINVAKSAILNYLETLNDVKLGDHALLIKFMKGTFNLRPALPRYVTTWDAGQVISYLETMKTDSLIELSQKVISLLALTTAQRLSTLHGLSLPDIHFGDAKCVIYVSALVKQSSPKNHQKPIELKCFHVKAICPVCLLSSYINKTSSLRKNVTKLFLTSVPPHSAASKDTLVRWVKTIMGLSGISKDFGVHSIRSACTSSVFSTLSIDTILNAAGWQSQTVFSKYYHKPLIENFGEAVLTANLHSA